jgi:hypothetical protein
VFGRLYCLEGTSVWKAPSVWKALLFGRYQCLEDTKCLEGFIVWKVPVFGRHLVFGRLHCLEGTIVWKAPVSLCRQISGCPQTIVSARLMCGVQFFLYLY